MTCTFFGHRVVPDEIEPVLRSVLVGLIVKEGVDRFYVGCEGEFDLMVSRTLQSLSGEYPIDWSVVLARLPQKREALIPSGKTLFPEGIERVPPRFAINYRNEWMIRHSDLLVCYLVRGAASSSAKWCELARKKGKRVIELVPRR